MSAHAPSVQPVHAGEPIRFDTLDAVRFLAFFAVFASHAVRPLVHAFFSLPALSFLPGYAKQTYWSGGYGVDLFLVLSAFLITTLLTMEQDRKGTVRVGGFYVRRMLRIWPLYLAFLGAMFFVDEIWAWGRAGFEPIDDTYWASFLLLVGNWHVGVSGFPEGNILPLWSVSLEEQFYLVWPWFILLARRNLVKVSAAMLVLASVARVALLTVDARDEAFWTFTITRLDPIALGVLMAVARSNRGSLPALSAPKQWLLFVGGFVSWPVLYLVTGWSRPVAALVRFPLVALAAAGILWAAIVSTGRLRRLLVHRWMVRMGTLSYGMYVLHYAVLALCILLVHDAIGASALASVVIPVVAFVLTWLLAEASYRWLETPFLRMRKRFRALPAAGDVPAGRPAPAASGPSGQGPT